MAWAKNGTPDTLSGTSSTLTISDLTAKIFNVFMKHYLKTSSQTCNTTFNNDTGSLYAYRISYSGGADSTGTSAAHLTDSTGNDVQGEFHIMYSCWVSGEEKLIIDFSVEGAATGAGTAPTRAEFVGKYVPSPLTDTCDRTDVTSSTSTMAIGSNVSALGTD